MAEVTGHMAISYRVQMAILVSPSSQHCHTHILFSFFNTTHSFHTGQQRHKIAGEQQRSRYFWSNSKGGHGTQPEQSENWYYAKLVVGSKLNVIFPCNYVPLVVPFGFIRHGNMRRSDRDQKEMRWNIIGRVI